MLWYVNSKPITKTSVAITNSEKLPLIILSRNSHPDQFTVNGYSGVLVDEDECQNGTHNCDVNAHCNNTLGSFNCTCLQGYLGEGVRCSGKTVLHY